ncbi:MAG: hypothetical protein DMF25_06320, partial [Verrucomicrobia bacterium]
MSRFQSANRLAKITLSIFALSILHSVGSAQEQQNSAASNSAIPSPDDTARFLAGMPLPKNSPLALLT